MASSGILSGGRGLRLVVEQHANRWRIEVVELSISHGPAERKHTDACQDDRYGNEDVQNLHDQSLAFRNDRCRIDEPTTVSELMGMAMAAINGVTMPAIASPAPATL